jgi:hypothetical protein
MLSQSQLENQSVESLLGSGFRPQLPDQPLQQVWQQIEKNIVVNV